MTRDHPLPICERHSTIAAKYEGYANRFQSERKQKMAQKLAIH
jgi:hypothetical protein